VNPRIILGLFTVSGMCALVYQLVWTRWLGLILGNFATATATVVATFMAGLAIGNALAGRKTSPLSPRSALRTYAFLELSLALLAGLSPVIFSTSSALYPVFTANSPTILVRTLFCVVLLLPPTILMGATLPVLVQSLSASNPGSLGALYALNTLGGAAGTLLAAFFLMPTLGLRGTIWLAAALNAAVSLAAYRISGNSILPIPSTGTGNPAPPQNDEKAGDSRNWIPYALAGVSGCIALGFEIALTRLFILTVTGSSVYGFALILSAYLIGIALGAFMVKRWPLRSPRDAFLAFSASMAIAWVFSLTTPFWDMLPLLLVRFWARSTSFILVSMFNFTVITALLLALTAASGYSLPALSAALRPAGSATVGRLFAFNTAGGVIGSLLTGFILLQWCGVCPTLLGLGAAAILCSAVGIALAEPAWRKQALVVASLLAMLTFLLPRSDPRLLNAGIWYRPFVFAEGMGFSGTSILSRIQETGKIVYESDSPTARVAIRTSGTNGLSFIVNGKPDGSSAYMDLLTHFLPAHLSVLLHSNPRSALVVGLGTGNTAGCLAMYPSIREVRVVEIEPAMLEVARYFADTNNNILLNRKVTINIDDVRNFLETDQTTYDIIISEPSNLYISGMVNLFTDEYYQMIKRHLKPGGVFCQWLHYYNMAETDMRGAIGTLLATFPQGTFWMPSYGDSFFIGSDAPPRIDPALIRRKMSLPYATENLRRLNISPPESILGFLVWGPHDLERFAAGARICTDDFPYLEFTTGRIRHRPNDEYALRSAMQFFRPLEPLPLAQDGAGLRTKLGELALASGNIARASTEFTRALELSPRSQSIAMKLAYIQWDILGLRDEAMATLSGFLRRNPGDPQAAARLRLIEHSPPRTGLQADGR